MRMLLGRNHGCGALAQPPAMRGTSRSSVPPLDSQVFPEKSCGWEDLGFPRKCVVSKALLKVLDFNNNLSYLYDVFSFQRVSASLPSFEPHIPW